MDFSLNFRHAFNDLLNNTDEPETDNKNKDSSASQNSKLILSCSFLKGYWEKNKGSYEGFNITEI